jgi:hypothetical protein
MFDLMNPQLVRMEEERRRRDILAAIQDSRGASARHRLGVWMRDVGERMAADAPPARLGDSRRLMRG